MFKTDHLTPMQRGRLNAVLDKQYSYSGAIKTLRQHIESLAAAGPLELSEGDGMIDYSRRHFNRLGSLKEQDAYIAGLKAKRYYWINDWKIPKLVHDALAQSLVESSDRQRLTPLARETSR